VTTRPKAIRQSIFTIVAKADAARASDLETHLAAIENSLMQQSALPFTAIETLHFCSITVFHDPDLGPYLVFEQNVDGTPNEHIETLCNLAAPALHTIYGFCPDYGAPGAVDPEYLRRYLSQHIVGARTAYIGNVGRSAKRVRDEASLVTEIGDFLDRLAAPDEATPDTIVAAVRDFVRSDVRWRWVWSVPPRIALRERVRRWSALSGVVALLLTQIVQVAIFLIVLRRRERTDPVHIPGPPPEQLQQLAAREDREVQNHMASLCYVKPGALRRRTLKCVLALANIVSRVSTNGKLLGLDSLHFAHWALVNDDTRMLFLTNYDGSWENYLDDFIDKAHLGLTAIWSNTLNFPRTRFLAFGGATDERKFKAIARTTQAYTNVWYSAYPSLTVPAIQNNSAICDGLSQLQSQSDAAAWLRRF